MKLGAADTAPITRIIPGPINIVLPININEIPAVTNVKYPKRYGSMYQETVKDTADNANQQTNK